MTEQPLTEFQAAILERIDIGLGFIIVAAAVLVALVAVVAVRSLWS